jgi:hypothetical protein
MGSQVRRVGMKRVRARRAGEVGRYAVEEWYMQYIAVVATVLVANACVRADEHAEATRVIDGTKTAFPAKLTPEGVKALTGALQSCHDMSDGTVRYKPDDVKKAQQGDHIRFVFAKPLPVEVLSKKLEVSEVVFAEGVFWLISGKEVVRCTKYEYHKMSLFREWFRQSLPAN